MDSRISHIFSGAHPCTADTAVQGRAVRSYRPCGLALGGPLLPSLARGWQSLCWGILLLVATSVWSSTELQAQTFPVNALVQVSNFSPRLEAYDDPGRVVVTLISTDERPEYEALLRVSLSGPGFNIRTREDFLPFPILLRRNQPLILTGAQLRDYFDPANLTFQGVSLENYLAGGGLLSEGPVSLCVEVYDYNRFFDPPVSNTGCSPGFMILHRPPILTEPGLEVMVSFPQQLRFQWQPQHAGVAVRYTLEVYEDILPGMGDNLIIDNTQPLLLKTTLAPFYLMTSLDPLLQVGSRYLVRVRAEDITGQAAFLNNGWSDIYSFVYLDDEDPTGDCSVPVNLMATALDPFTAQVSWQPDPTVASWLLTSNANDSIPLADTAQTYTFTGLTPAEVYYYQLCAICTDGSSQCSQTTITLPVDTTSGPCGPTLLLAQLPIDDEGLLLTWNDIPTAQGFRLRWGVVPPGSPSTPLTPTNVQGAGQPTPGAPQGRRGRRRNGGFTPAPPPTMQATPAPTFGTIPAVFVYTDSLSLPTGSLDAEVDDLALGSTYQIELCKICPDGSLECTIMTVTFNGLDDDCLTSLDIIRTDSTDTSLTLNWTADPADYSTDSTFVLIWQLSDGTAPPDSAVLQYPSGTFTIDSLEAFRAYDIRICAECTSGQPACLELEPFGGCPAAYAPYLADIETNNALIAWEPPPGDSLLLTKARYKARVALQWDSLNVGQHSYFTPGNYSLTANQTAEVLSLSRGITYLAQIQTQCADSIWSDWSEPVLFNIDCAVGDSLWLNQLTDSSALVAGLSYSNAAYYAFEYRRTDQQNWTVVNNLPNSVLGMQALRAETDYEVRMRYWCTQGVWSDYSPSFFFTTLPPCEPPFRITVDPILADAAQLNWDNYINATQVELRYRPKLSGYYYMSFWPPPWQTALVPDSLLYLAGLQGGAAYEYQMRSDCLVNLSEWTAVDEFALLCSPPEVIAVTDSTYESAIVQLSGFPSSVQSSTLQYRRLGDSSWISRPTTFGYTSMQNLDDMTYYELRATATCSSGQTSAFSDTIQFRTPVKCLIPENLVASDLQPFSAQIDWDVTGTIDEWEVLVYGPIGPALPITAAPQQAAPLQMTPGMTPGQSPSPGGGTPPANNSSRGGGRQTNPGGSTPAGGSPLGGAPVTTAPLTTAPLGVSVNPTPVLQPYANWHSFFVTNPTKLLEELRHNTDYLVVVRARCPEFGWTDYSDTLSFRTLKDCRIPVNLVANEIYQTTTRTNWMAVNSHAEEYMVSLESLYPIPVGGPTQQGAPTQGVRQGGGSPQMQGGGQIPAGGQSPAGGQTQGRGGQGQRNSSGGGDAFSPSLVDYAMDFTSFVYYRDSILTPELNAMFTGLQPNTEYRFRVKSRCDNYGWTDYSDWVIFRTDECSIPQDIVEEALDRSTMRIAWTPSNGINDYEFKYKLADDPGADWITFNTPDAEVELSPLLSNQIYDYQITEICQGGTGQRVAPQDSFLMERPSLNNGFYVCGMEGQVDLSNQIPLAALVPGDTIIAFDFPITITMASGGGGYFSGMGDIQMPYFNKAKFTFEFDNIFVNDEYRMVGGYLEATGFGVEVLPPWADSLLSDILDVLELADSVLQQEQIGILEDLIALGENANLPPNLQQDIQDVLDCFEQAATQAQIDSCNVLLDSVLVAVNEFLDQLYEGDFQVVFKKDQNQQFGFDGKRSQEPEAWYDKRTLAGADYIVPYKSVKENGPDLVDGVVLPPGLMDSVAFSQPSGIPLPTTIDGDTATITFMGQTGNDYFLVAEQITNDSTPNYIAGLLNVVPYPELPLQVVLVPLSTSAASGLNPLTIEQGLLSILGQAVVKPSVIIDAAFTVPGYDGVLDDVGSGMLTNYSPEMRDIIDAYENRPSGADPNKYYLFLTDSYETTQRSGFMPRGRQFGFVYMGNAGSGSALHRTIAHELAHGAYVLRHTFEVDGSAMPASSTDNLMDYSTGTHLYKWQWDLIHDPVGAPLLPGDETGESNTLNQIAFLDSLRNNDGTLTFMSPAGKPITLPADVKSVTFNTGDNIGVKETCFPGFAIYPFGSLRSFTLGNDVSYNTFLNCNNTGNFYAYGYSASSVIDSFYLDTFSVDLPVPERMVIYIVPQSQNNAPGWIARQASWDDIDFDDLSVLNGNYGAQGARKSFDFIVQNLSGITGGEVVPLQNDDNFTNDAEQLLTIAAAWGGTSESAMVYAYTHAHQMSRYPLLLESCNSTQLNGVDYMALQAKLYKMYEKAEEENQTNPYRIVYEDPSLVLGKDEIETWQAADESIYENYDDLYQQIISTQSILNYPNNETGANQLIRLLKFWEENPCAVADLSLPERLHILEVLQHGTLNTEQLWGLIGEEHQGLYNNVLSVTEPHEYQQVIDLYKANGFQLYEAIHSKFDDTAYDFFVGTLANMVIQRRSFEKQGFILRNQAYEPNGSVSTYYTVGVGAQNPPYTGSSVMHPVDAFVENPSSYFSSGLGNLGSGFKIVIATGVFPSTRELQRTQADPFAPVALKFLHDVTFGANSPSPISVTAGQILVLPMCLAELLYRNYRDANWDRNFKAFITVVAVAGAAAAIVFTGGTAAGVVFAVLATADAVAATAVYSLSDDAYSWETTGQGQIDQSVHQTVDNISMIVGITNIVGLVSYGGGKLIFNFNKIKTAVSNLRNTAPAKLANLKSELKELYRLVKQYGVMGINHPELLRIEHQLRAELAAMYLNEAADILAPASSLHLRPNLTPIVLRNGTEIPLGIAGDMYNNLYHMRPGLWLSSPPANGKVLELTNVNYYDQLGQRQFGKLTFYEDAANPSTWRCFPQTIFIPHADDFPEFFTLFQQRNWNWSTRFTQEARNYISNLSSSERAILRNKFSNWPDSWGEQANFSRIFDDLAQNLYPNGFTNSAVNTVVNKVTTTGVREAIDDAIKFSADPDLILLKGQYEGLMTNWHRGILPYDEFILTRNQIRASLIDALPPASLVGSGGLPGATPSIVNKIVNNQLGGALDDILIYNADANLQKIFLNLRGQQMDLVADWNRGIITYETRTLMRNQIRAATMDALGIAGTANVSATAAEAIRVKIVSGNIQGALDDAFTITGNQMYTQMKARYQDLIADWNAGIITYETRTVMRNQIRFNLVEELPLAATGSGGLTPPVVSSIQARVAAGELRGAMDDAVLANTNLDTYEELMQHMGRYEDLMSDWANPIMSYEEYTVTLNQVRAHFLETITQ